MGSHNARPRLEGQIEAPPVQSSPPQVVIARQPSPRPEPPSGLPLDNILHSLRRRWKIALPIAVCLAVGGAVAGWLLMIPVYRASAFLRIDSDNRPLIFQTADQTGGGARGFDLYRNTQAQMMVTPFVLNAALRDGKLNDVEEIREAANPVDWLRENLQVGFPNKGEIMEVSIETGSGPGSVATINAVVEAYMNEVVVHERNKRLQRLNNLERVYSEAEGKIRNKRSELKSLAEALGTGDSSSLTVAQQTALNQFGMMQQKLSDIQFELMRAEGELEIGQELHRRAVEHQAANASDSEEEPEMEMPEFDPRTPEVEQLEREVASLEAELDSMSKLTGPNHPSILRVKRQLEVKESLLARAEKMARAEAEKQREEWKGMQSSGQMVSSADGKQTFDLDNLIARIEVLKSQERSLQSRVDDLASETRQLGRSSIDVELMRSEINSLEGVLARVGEEIERTSIELKTSSRVEILSEAESATPPDPKKRIALAAALGVLGLVLPFGLFTAWDLSRKKVTNLDSVNTSLSLATLGSIPIVPQQVLHHSESKRGRRFERQSMELSESVAATAAMLLHRAEEEHLQVFMISSAIPGEGKSTVACQLAKHVADSGRKVALVDFDLRRPAVHKQFELELSPGVRDVLQYSHDWSKSEQYCGESLSIFTAGGRISNLNTYCSNGAIAGFIEALRNNFDIVIIDTCPVLPVVDTRLIAKYSDGVVLSMVRDHSRLPMAGRACEMLKAHGANVLGAIVIGATNDSYPSYYYYGAKEETEPEKPTLDQPGDKGKSDRPRLISSK